MSDDLESAFPGLTKKYKVAYSTRNKRKYSKISLNLSAATKTKCDQSNTKEDQHITDHLRNEEILDDVTWEEFFTETHENQDPDNSKLIDMNQKTRRQSELVHCVEQEKLERQKVLKQLKNKWTAHLAHFNVRVNELQKKIAARQSKQREELIEQNNLNTNALKDRGNDELNALIDRSTMTEKKILSDFQQFSDPNRSIAPQLLQMELHKHRKKVTELKANLNNKVRELLAESEADHKKKFLRLEKHHHRRRAELGLAIEKLSTTCRSRHEQLNVRRMKCHEDKFQKMHNEILNKSSDFQSKTDSEGGERPVSATESTPENESLTNEKQSYGVGAAVRQKRRKFLFAKCPTFMTVEIHNEGLNVSCRNENLNGGDNIPQEITGKISNDYIPWGISARKFLHSIVIGRIPNHGIIDHRLANQIGLQGQIKCLVADMRVPADVAIAQRQAAKQGSDMNELSQLAEATKTTLSLDIKAETLSSEAVKSSMKVLEKSKQKLLHLRNQTQKYLDKEGGEEDVNRSENYQKLVKIFSKCKGIVDTSENEHKKNTNKLALARAKRIHTTAEYKKILQDFANVKKFHSRELDSREYNEDDNLMSFLSVFHKVASERRSSQKDKHPKRVIIILRSQNHSSKEVNNVLSDHPGELKTNDENKVRAEQLLLLSQHPCPETKLSQVPLTNSTSSSEWAEPGWHLDLEVPTNQNSDENACLPAPPPNNLFNSLHSEICSGIGHQMASLVNTSHLKSLVIEGDENRKIEGDLLSLNEDQIAHSYNIHFDKSETMNTIPSKKRKKPRKASLTKKN